jgi:hypothetical protein
LAGVLYRSMFGRSGCDFSFRFRRDHLSGPAPANIKPRKPAPTTGPCAAEAVLKLTFKSSVRVYGGESGVRSSIRRRSTRPTGQTELAGLSIALELRTEARRGLAEPHPAQKIQRSCTRAQRTSVPSAPARSRSTIPFDIPLTDGLDQMDGGHFDTADGDPVECPKETHRVRLCDEPLHWYVIRPPV